MVASWGGVNARAHYKSALEVLQRRNDIIMYIPRITEKAFLFSWVQKFLRGKGTLKCPFD